MIFHQHFIQNQGYLHLQQYLKENSVQYVDHGVNTHALDVDCDIAVLDAMNITKKQDVLNLVLFNLYVLPF
jgi:hypothetical protein